MLPLWYFKKSLKKKRNIYIYIERERERENLKFDQENLTKGPNEMMSWRLKFVRVVEIGISKELQPYDVNREAC